MSFYCVNHYTGCVSLCIQCQHQTVWLTCTFLSFSRLHSGTPRCSIAQSWGHSKTPCSPPSLRSSLSKMKINLWKLRLAGWEAARWRWASSSRIWKKKKKLSKTPERRPVWRPWTCWLGHLSSGGAGVMLWRRSSPPPPASCRYAASHHHCTSQQSPGGF